MVAYDDPIKDARLLSTPLSKKDCGVICCDAVDDDDARDVGVAGGLLKNDGGPAICDGPAMSLSVICKEVASNRSA